MKRLGIATLIACLALGGCLGYKKSDIEKEFYRRAKQDEAAGLVKVIKQLEDAHFAYVEPIYWSEFESSMLRAEQVMRENDLFTPENSAKLRREYLVKADKLRSDILQEREGYNAAARIAANQEDGWRTEIEIANVERELNAKMLDEINTAFDPFLASLLTTSPASDAAYQSAVNEAKTLVPQVSPKTLEDLIQKITPTKDETEYD